MVIIIIIIMIMIILIVTKIDHCLATRLILPYGANHKVPELAVRLIINRI